MPHRLSSASWSEFEGAQGGSCEGSTRWCWTKRLPPHAHQNHQKWCASRLGPGDLEKVLGGSHAHVAIAFYGLRAQPAFHYICKAQGDTRKAKRCMRDENDLRRAVTLSPLAFCLAFP